MKLNHDYNHDVLSCNLAKLALVAFPKFACHLFYALFHGLESSVQC